MEIAEDREFIRGLSALHRRHRGCVATIGSFDGVHTGHQALMKNLVAAGRRLQLPSLVMVFEPQPNEYFSRGKVPARLMRLREKVAALFALGVDRVLCVRFNDAFRSLTARAFIEEILVRGLEIQHLIIGDDFRFGCDRVGDFQLLQDAGLRNGFEVKDTGTLLAEGDRISSTRIRQLLADDKLAQAARLLGREYRICGRVVYGQQLGRSIGVPTANIGLGRYHSPVHGVYVVELCADGVVYPAVANIGLKPTVDGSGKPLLEVHAIDAENARLNLYKKFVSVVFKKKIRAEKQFESLEQLRQQIVEDIASATQYFAANKQGQT